MGLFSMGSNDFALVYVNGLSLVPNPPARMIASIFSSLLMYVQSRALDPLINLSGTPYIGHDRTD
jgi:hypothetical protein